MANTCKFKDDDAAMFAVETVAGVFFKVADDFHGPRCFTSASDLFFVLHSGEDRLGHLHLCSGARRRLDAGMGTCAEGLRELPAGAAHSVLVRKGMRNGSLKFYKFKNSC